MERYQQLLKNCVEQSQKLLEYAKSEEWDKLESLLQQRDKQLLPLLQAQFAASQAADLRQAIAAIRACDQQIKQLVERHKDVIFKGLKKSDSGKKMKAAYGSTQRSFR